MIAEKIIEKSTKLESLVMLVSRHIKFRKGKGLITAKDATGLIRLRSSCNELTPSQIHLLPHIRVRERHNNIFLCHSTISHEYKRKKIRKEKTL